MNIILTHLILEELDVKPVSELLNFLFSWGGKT